MAKIRITTVATETSPPVGQLAIFAKNDKNLYLKDSTGLERAVLNDASPGASGYTVQTVTLDALQAAAKEILLDDAPAFPSKTLLQIDGAGASFYSVDFTVAGDVLSWAGLRLDGLLEAGDTLQVIYIV